LICVCGNPHRQDFGFLTEFSERLDQCFRVAGVISSI
jgi:hypothetical protein